MDIATDLSAQELVEHFDQQMRDQGWRDDTRWFGEYSSGSSWSIVPEEELSLAGLLDIVPLGESGYQATFRVSSLEIR